MSFLLVTGDLVEGFSFIGPFDSRAEAEEYAREWAMDSTPRVVVILHKPEVP